MAQSITKSCVSSLKPHAAGRVPCKWIIRLTLQPWEYSGGWGMQAWTQGCCILISVPHPRHTSGSILIPVPPSGCSQFPSQQIDFEWLLFSAGLLDEVITFSYHNSHETAKDIHILVWISAGQLLGNDLNICAITAGFSASLRWTKGTLTMSTERNSSCFDTFYDHVCILKKHKITVLCWNVRNCG